MFSWRKYADLRASDSTRASERPDEAGFRPTRSHLFRRADRDGSALSVERCWIRSRRAKSPRGEEARAAGARARAGSGARSRPFGRAERRWRSQIPNGRQRRAEVRRGTDGLLQILGLRPAGAHARLEGVVSVRNPADADGLGEWIGFSALA